MAKLWMHVKLSEAPSPMDCRWCGATKQDHCQRWVKSAGWHGWVEPTKAQINARLRVKLTRGKS